MFDASLQNEKIKTIENNDECKDNQKPKPKPAKKKSTTTFQIKSDMSGGKVLYVAEYMGGSQYKLRIRTPRNDKREFFVYDKESGTIRFNLDQRFVLAHQKGNFRKGATVTLRPYNARLRNELGSVMENNAIKNSKFKDYCLDVVGGKDENG